MNEFEAVVSKSAKLLGLHYVKIPMAMRPSPMGPVLLKTNPYDSFLVRAGKHVALELKSFSSKSFPLGNIKEHQIVGLKDCLAASGEAYVLLSYNGPPRRVWSLNMQKWDTLLAKVPLRSGSPMKSISIAFIESHPDLFSELRQVEFKAKCRQKVWDLLSLS